MDPDANKSETDLGSLLDMKEHENIDRKTFKNDQFLVINIVFINKTSEPLYLHLNTCEVMNF